LRVRASFVATSAVVAVAFVASCGGSRVIVGPNPPPAPSTIDGLKTVTIDSGTSRVYTTPDVALDEVAKACATDRDVVRLDLRQGDIHLVHVFDCATARHHKAQGAAQLVALVADRHDASSRADRINTVARQLAVHPYSRAEMVWVIGTGIEGCTPLRDAAFYRQEIESAGRSATHENPQHWTKVEVARLVGTCPAQLSAFLATVRGAGQPYAAAAVRADLIRIDALEH
jgi:hypothetical protein